MASDDPDFLDRIADDQAKRQLRKTVARSRSQGRVSTNYKIGCLTVVGFMWIAVLAIAVILSIQGDGQHAEPHRIDPYVEAKLQVLKNLKAPATAVFPESASRVRQLAGGRVRVDGYVDAQNSFGALLRSDFTVTLQREDAGKWGLVSISIKNR